MVLVFTLGCDLLAKPGSVLVGRGVTMEFTEYPSEVYEDQGFGLEIVVSNYGDQEVDGFVCISDTTSQTYMGIPSNECQPTYLPPALIQEGSVTPSQLPLLFPSSSSGMYRYLNLPKEDGIQEIYTSIAATFSYKTATIASTTICLENFNVDEPSCEKNEVIKNIKQQKMPIEVTEIEKVSYTSQDGTASISLIVHIKKMEKGDIIDPLKLQNSKQTMSPTIGFSINLAETIFKCQPLESGNKVKFMTGDETVVRCTGTKYLGDSEFINDPLIILLDYGFQVRESIPIIIRKEVIL